MKRATRDAGEKNRKKQAGRAAFPVFLFLMMFTLHCAPFLPFSPAPMDATPEQIVEAITANFDRLRDLDAKVKVRIEAGDIRETSVARVLFREPDWLKIELKGPLGVTVANILMVGDTVRVYYPMSNILLQGRPTAEHFEVMTGIQMDVSDFRSLLAGQGGIARQDLSAVHGFEIEGREYILEYEDGGTIQKHWIDSKKLLITRSEFYEGRDSLTVRQWYRRYETFHAVQLPTRISIEKIEGHQTVRMTLVEGTVNEGVSEDRFRLNVPADVERIELRF